MNTFFDDLNTLCASLSDAIWSVPMIVLLMGVGVLMTIGTRFFQVSHLFHWLKSSIGTIFSKNVSSSQNEGLSRFQALCTALASTIGTGNITGTATAIAMGGPGAVFWMWVSAFFGMMTAYAENVLGIYYRRKNPVGNCDGGPMYYIRECFSKRRLKWFSNALAVLFCIFCILVSFGMGNMAQANSISMAFESTFGISALKSGALIALGVIIIIIGGTKRIGRTAEKLVPPMAIFYMFCSLWIIFSNYDQIPHVFKSIFSSAFSFKSASGAGGGLLIKHAVSVGFRRGLCSHEAGLGSAVFAHSSSGTKEPCVQGMVGIFVVFFDTLVICTLTAFVLLSTVCPVASLEKALSGITKDAIIVNISNDKKAQGLSLMDSSLSTHYTASCATDANATRYTVSPKAGIPFDVYIKKEELSPISKTHTNVMTVRGVSLGANGEEIKDKNAPINAVKLEKIEGASLVSLAFTQKFGPFAVKLLAVAIFLFAFSSIVGWSFYGLKAWQYLFKGSSGSVYKIIFPLCTFLGANVKLDLVWNLSDIFNGFMAIPNLIALVLFCPLVFKITDNYVNRKIKGNLLKPILSIYEEKRKL